MVIAMAVSTSKAGKTSKTGKSVKTAHRSLIASREQHSIFAGVFTLLVLLFLVFQAGHARAIEANTASATSVSVATATAQPPDAFRAAQVVILRTALGFLPNNKTPPMLKTFLVLGAMRYDRQDLVAELFRWGISPNALLPYRLAGHEGMPEVTPLAAAIFGKTSPDMFRFLVEQGADLELPVMGTRPLHLALCTGKYGKANLLLDLGANPRAIDPADGSTSLMQLISCSGGQYNSLYEQLFRRLVAMGVEVNARDKWGMSTLALATILSREKEVELLLKLGADPNIPDLRGNTALKFARDVVQKNLNKAPPEGFDPLNPNSKSTPENIVRLLESAGARL